MLCAENIHSTLIAKCIFSSFLIKDQCQITSWSIVKQINLVLLKHKVILFLFNLVVTKQADFQSLMCHWVTFYSPWTRCKFILGFLIPNISARLFLYNSLRKGPTQQCKYSCPWIHSVQWKFLINSITSLFTCACTHQ